MLIKSPELGNLCFDYFIHCKLKVLVNAVSPLTFFSFQGVDSHFNIQVGMWQVMEGMEVFHLRECRGWIFQRC